jgi:hypothetical protein
MMLQIPTPPPTNAAATIAATGNVSAIATVPGITPAAVIGFKSIRATIPNVVASNRGGSGAAQKAANANTQKRLGHFSQLCVATQKRDTA